MNLPLVFASTISGHDASPDCLNVKHFLQFMIKKPKFHHH
ncbi:hypothetical protein Cabys_3340 [Caldithrix abyssi DSM 13497]|uniref:Uncharacterized protein n=1 Tax=Caldithrix abyssi DSM 13497 TaxID=880073 RepID=A0A1J1CDW7_CALAY|nr:hypothetical protein Cabys_3340 [Caldithrix abyssi DSM 13497]